MMEGQGKNGLLPNGVSRVKERGLDILVFKAGVFIEDFFLGHALRHEFKYEVHWNASSGDNGLPGQNTRVLADSLEQSGFDHFCHDIRSIAGKPSVFKKPNQIIKNVTEASPATSFRMLPNYP